MKELINVVVQAIYGNRTGMSIDEDEMDYLIIGCLDKDFYRGKKLDRTMIQLPCDEHLYIVYNQYQEQKSLEDKERLLKEENYELKPLAIIDELKLQLYSRPLVCRKDDDGNIVSLLKEDYPKFMHYLAR